MLIRSHNHRSGKSLRWFSLVVLFVGVCFLRLPSAEAAQINAEWTYVGNGDWMDPGNWKDGVVPVQSQTDQYNVLINNATDPFAYIQFSLAGTDMEVPNLTLAVVLY